MNLYRTECVLALDIGFMHTNDTSCVYGIRVHGHDGTSEYSPKSTGVSQEYGWGKYEGFVLVPKVWVLGTC